MNDIRSITQSTPVSIALVVALCGGAFWTGSQFTGLSLRVQHVEKDSYDLKELTKEVSSLASDNKRRLDILTERK